ncbi:GGDEF domain-containing protein [Nitratireductor rhodophyticola]|uniref:diguanylate cyclase n=3 Tax=Hyphomicrobiales TaxID=356 RepID=K2NYP8_9HYPH|nr:MULTISPECIES: GGDEF domain-containing protein [Hyphomicrobiales]EZQ15248.1 diguanylate cyclase [Halopseudomonas bauzanensis]ALV26101.1 diguanylate cyclase [Pannonibacter phragmitetus]EKF40201.1 diguanylate cyclase [Nitratireductor indicus C115]EXL03641.1 diguanylate cyclase [Aquamicrobium defluvii]TDR32076.1 diguanylate cyclase (GGDEF)-like protein [Aquamicrobium defluvii]
MRYPSGYVVRRTAITTLAAACLTISISTGARWLVGAEADAITIAVRLILPFAVGIPISLLIFTRFEQLNRSYREMLQKNAELSRRAMTDPLTGLLNRRSFIEQFELAQSIGVGGTFILADIDYLKQINDRYGHSVGDEAVLTASIALMRVLGDDALIARIGGDEFCAFVARIDGKNFDTLRRRVNEETMQEFRKRSGLGDYALSMTISQQRCRSGMSFKDMLVSTDKDLYRFKRNRPVHAPALDPAA